MKRRVPKNKHLDTFKVKSVDNHFLKYLKLPDLKYPLQEKILILMTISIIQNHQKSLEKIYNMN